MLPPAGLLTADAVTVCRCISALMWTRSAPTTGIANRKLEPIGIAHDIANENLVGRDGGNLELSM